MGFRYQRRINLGGGAGLNLSKSGISASYRTKYGSIGPRGFSLRTGIPGLTFRSGRGSKGSGAAIVLLVMAAILVASIGLVILWNLLRFITWACIEGYHAFLRYRMQRQAAKLAAPPVTPGIKAFPGTAGGVQQTNLTTQPSTILPNVGGHALVAPAIGVGTQKMTDDFSQQGFDTEISDLIDNPEQRCPCLLLLDTSGSMSGRPIEELNAGLATLQTELNGDSLAAKRVELSIVTFGPVEVKTEFTSAQVFLPLDLPLKTKLL